MLNLFSCFNQQIFTSFPPTRFPVEISIFLPLTPTATDSTAQQSSRDEMKSDDEKSFRLIFPNAHIRSHCHSSLWIWMAEKRTARALCTYASASPQLNNNRNELLKSIFCCCLFRRLWKIAFEGERGEKLSLFFICDGKFFLPSTNWKIFLMEKHFKSRKN